MLLGLFGVVALSMSFLAAPQPISAERVKTMTPAVYRAGCPVPLSELREVQVPYLNFEDEYEVGTLIVHKEIAWNVASIFKSLMRQKFRIEKVRPIEHYRGSDDASMSDNNTSAFNCRPVAGSKKLSKHAYGLAVDINPRINPYIRKTVVQPENGKAYVDRSQDVPGLIRKGAITSIFIDAGARWGGNWKSLKDYQHFEWKMPRKTDNRKD